MTFRHNILQLLVSASMKKIPMRTVCYLNGTIIIITLTNILKN